MKRIIKYLTSKLTISDYNVFCATRPTRKALLSYLVFPLILPIFIGRRDFNFSNHGIAREIPRALNELGFQVDIINFDNKSWRPSKKYDLFIGHGGVNFRNITTHLSSNSVRIYFATGIYWREFNKRIAKRLYNLAIRRGYLLKAERYVNTDEEFANRASDGILCLGNENAVRTFKSFKKVIGINNAIYPVAEKDILKKDFHSARKHFLFFNGGGNVEKGLDLLIEAFSKTDLHLHVCHNIQEEFKKVYNFELSDNNIHLYGFVKMRSSKFNELVNKCNWTISATCAEGQPGGPIECIGHGLIPILPQTANMDIENFGFKLPFCNVDSIRKTIIQLKDLDITKCKFLAQEAIKKINENYSVDYFRDRLKNAINEIMNFSLLKKKNRLVPPI